MEDYLSLRASLSQVSRVSAELRHDFVDRLDSILQREPNFARALGARAVVEATINFFEPSRELQERAEADADRALKVDPHLVEARIARALILYSSSGGWRIYD